MTVRLHDSKTGALQVLRPHAGNRVGIYACGPTVYNRIHVGNARPYVVFSLLKRLLEHEGHDVTLVVNVTDVNDKIYDAARLLGVPSVTLAAEMTAHYLADTDALALGRPDAEPLASESIAAIVAYIQALLDRGAAYAAGGDVYFRVRADTGYGTLSHRVLDDMDQGEVEADPALAQLKQDPLDFALWKAHKEGEDSAWPAPWGRGRPGWHVECSAMAEQALGLGFEIHGGGNDLTFPHHENEAAQTRMARGAELARIWMHNGMLQLGDKMSKSTGNVVSLADALERHGRDTLVLYFVSAHYRGPVQYDDAPLAQAAASVRRIRDAGRRLVVGPSPDDMAGHRQRFFAALRDDFNTPTALAAAFAWVREANTRDGVGSDDLVEMLQVLGLEGLLARDDAQAGAEEEDLLQAREDARSASDFAEADRLRDALRSRGWEVRDGPDGPELVASR